MKMVDGVMSVNYPAWSENAVPTGVASPHPLSAEDVEPLLHTSLQLRITVSMTKTR